MRVAIRVRPGASRTRVGGAYGERLVVAVGARAVDGAATEAALDAVAKAFGVRRRAVTLVAGATSRDKVVQIELADDAAAAEAQARLAGLLAVGRGMATAICGARSRTTWPCPTGSSRSRSPTAALASTAGSRSGRRTS